MATYRDVLFLVDKVTPSLKKIAKNTDDVSQKVNKGTDKLNRFGNKGQEAVQKIENQMHRLNSALRGVGQALVAAFSVQKIVQIGGYINKMGSQFEDTLVDLEVMLGSAAKAQKMFKDIQTMAIKTPFETSDLLESTKLMLNFGIAEDKVLDYTRMLGDVAGGDKNRFKSLALAFSQISANGKLQGQDRLQMVNAGFNPLQELSKMTGKSMAQLDGEMSDGKISFDMVAKAIQNATSKGGKFYNLMDKRSQTFSGKMSTLADSVSLWAGTTGMAINKKLLPVLDKIAPVVDNSLNKLSPVILRLTNYFANLFNTIGSNPAIMNLKNEFALLNRDVQAFITKNPEFIKALKDGLDWILKSGIANALAGITKTIRGFFAVFTAINNFFKALGELIGTIVGTIISIPNMVQTVFINMINAITQALMPMFRLINEAKAALADSATSARSFMNGMNNNKTINNRTFSTITNDNRSFGGHTFNISTKSDTDMLNLLHKAGYNTV